MLNIIPDGYTENGFIAEAPGLHGELRFAYRPMLSEERDTIDRAAQASPVSQVHAMYRKALAMRLQSWSEVDDKGVPSPINDATLKRLRPTLFDKLYNTVAGYRASDADPAKSKPASQVDGELEAALAGRPVGEVREEGDLKN